MELTQQVPTSSPENSRVEVSIIVPMFNEEETVNLVVASVKEQVGGCAQSYELICVDDGSSDGTPAILDHLADGDPRIRAVHFSRNFGKEAALMAGIDLARGAAVVLIDADLQHPPTLIPQMVETWRAGMDVVEAHKRRRNRENRLYRSLAWAFYRLMGLSTGADLRGSSDYKLLDRQVVEALRKLPERGRFFRGLVAWIGFQHERIEFDVQERAGGDSGWSRAKLVQYAMNNVFAFSTVPLIVTAWVGVFSTVFAVLLAIDTLVNYLEGRAVSGFTTTIMAVAFFSGITLLGIGVVAVYVAKVLEEVKGRPLYIIRQPAGSSSAGPTDPTTGE